MSDDLVVEQGSFLAAGPDLLDPNFVHTVVLMCQHGAQGAYGLILNRPSEFSAGEVLAGRELWKSSALPVYVGGPVGLETLQIVHRAPERIHGGVPIARDLWIGGDIDEVGRFALEDPHAAARAVRLFIGYSGWGAGQLEVELATGSWLPARGSAERVFLVETSDLWRDVVRSISSYRGLADEPSDPRVN
jgi:putative transcriptional regulator